MWLLRTLPITLLYLALSQTANCQSFKCDLDNSLSINNFQYLDRTKDINSIAELRSDHELKLKYKTNLAVKLAARGLYNYTNRQRSKLFLNEAYIAWNKGRLNTKLGKQVIKYGKLTGISNLDLANRYDYFDFLITDEEELGQWGLTSKFDTKHIQFDFNYIYNVEPSLIYFTDNPWTRLPSELAHSGVEGGMLPVKFRDVVNVDQDVRRSAYDLGVNIELFGFTTRFDLYKGSNDIAFRKLNLDTNTQSYPITYDLELSQEALSIYNLNVQKLLGDWNIWLEFGLIKNKFSNAGGSVVSDDYSLLSIGVDRLVLFEDPAKLLKLVGQWRYAIWNNKFDYSATDLDHVLDRCFIADMDYQHSYRLSFGLRSVLSYDSFGLYLSPSLNYKLSDRFLLAVDYDLLRGNDSSFFGHYSNNDRFIFKIKLEL